MKEKHELNDEVNAFKCTDCGDELETCGDNCCFSSEHEHNHEHCGCGEECDCDCECGEECDCEDCECGEDCDCDDHECDCEDCQSEEDEEEHCDCGHDHGHDDNGKNISNETLYYLEMAQRLQADFNNYKRRNENLAKDSYNRGLTTAIEKLLTVVDSVTQAKLKIKDEQTLQGINIIYSQMINAFEALGVKKINCLNKQFDPNFHNAVMAVNDKKFKDNEVVEEIQEGFVLDNKVIRHSVVKINKL